MDDSNKLNSITDDLAVLKNDLMLFGDDETKLRLEIAELEKTKKSFEDQLGCINSSKATFEKSKNKMYKQGYKSNALEFSKSIKSKNEDIAILESLIENNETMLRKKRKELRATVLKSNNTLKRITYLTVKHKNELNLANEQIKSDRELAIYAGVRGPFLKSILVIRSDDGSVEIHFRGIGSKERDKSRIIATDKKVYRKDKGDIEPVLIPIHREHSS